MTEVMAVELGAHRVRVNCVAPGPIDTASTERLHPPAERRAWLDHIPQRRYGETDEVASVVEFLLSDGPVT